MLQEEFEKMTGLEITAETFEQVHDIYMACGDDMDKADFCALWKKRNFRDLLGRAAYEHKITNQAYDMAMARIERIEATAMDLNGEYAEFLLGKAAVYKDTDFYNEAVRMIGEKEVVMTKLRMGFPLWDEDIEYIKNNLK